MQSVKISVTCRKCQHKSDIEGKLFCSLPRKVTCSVCQNTMKKTALSSLVVYLSLALIWSITLIALQPLNYLLAVTISLTLALALIPVSGKFFIRYD